jgi:hypothetical protein
MLILRTNIDLTQTYHSAQSYNLGTYLRSIYLDQSSSSHVRGLKSDLADIKQVYIRSKAGAEGTVCFDSSIAL